MMVSGSGNRRSLSRKPRPSGRGEFTETPQAFATYGVHFSIKAPCQSIRGHAARLKVSALAG